MTIALVNVSVGYHDANDTPVSSGAQSHTAGNLLVIFVANFANGTVSTITDTAGNIYTFVRRISVSNKVLELWYAKNILGNASNIVTATHAGNCTFKRIEVLQYSGCDKDAPYDVGNQGSGTGTSQNTPTATINFNNEVICACYLESATYAFTAGSNFTLVTEGLLNGMVAEERIVSSIDSYDSTITYGSSASYVSIHGTFREQDIPPVPTGIGAFPGNQQNTISWATSVGATSYNIYWDTETGVTKEIGTKIEGATSPHIHTELENGQPYFYVVTAVNTVGESDESDEVSGTPEVAATTIKSSMFLIF